MSICVSLPVPVIGPDNRRLVVARTSSEYRKSSNKRPRRLLEHGAKTPRRLLETRRLLKHELQHPGVCCMLGLPCAKSVLRSLIGLTSFHCVVTQLGLFLSVCGWSQA